MIIKLTLAWVHFVIYFKGQRFFILCMLSHFGSLGHLVGRVLNYCSFEAYKLVVELIAAVLNSVI